MSNYPIGANEDKRAPWHEKPTEYKECPECDGAGSFDYSECCGASLRFHDICSYCGEHSGKETCEVCGGSGKVPMTEEDYEQLREQAADNEFEASRED